MLFALAMLEEGSANRSDSCVALVKGEETMGRDISVDQERLGGSANAARLTELGDDSELLDTATTTPLGCVVDARPSVWPSSDGSEETGEAGAMSLWAAPMLTQYVAYRSSDSAKVEGTVTGQDSNYREHGRGVTHQAD